EESTRVRVLLVRPMRERNGGPMSREKSGEGDRVWLTDHGWLTDEQIAQCEPADVGEPFHSPVPTQMVSNGEYMPIPQTEEQQRVEERIKDLVGSASKRLGVDRRSFLRSSGGTAAAFIAMNEIFGKFFDVDAVEMFEPTAYAQAGTPRDLFVFDDQ